VKLTFFMKESDRKKAEAKLSGAEILRQYWEDFNNREEAGVMSDAERVVYSTFITVRAAGEGK
jgi:hypothetical protein